MTTDYNQAVRQLVDELKANCFSYGLGGNANEYKIVTQMFLYKFLNDKFLHSVKQKRPDLTNYAKLAALSEDEYNMLLREIDYNAAQMRPQHLLEYLFSRQDVADFAKTFDETLNDIAIKNNDIFSVHTAGGADIRLFEERLIHSSINDKSQCDAFAKGIINKLANATFDFEEIFSAGFDFFSTLFEYMIKDYNKDGGGKYAEYYTPHSVAKIMAEILVGNDADLKSQTVYDPSAGSGTLLMNIASKIGAARCSIYSQDITQKSVELLRLNLILNNLSHSIDNIVQGNTILNSRHTQKMDFIVSNPPFKLDFSEWQNSVSLLPDSTERFFAGVPNIPNKDKDKMSIYLLFLQHIMFSLSKTGKAAIVVPTGFITAQSGIEKKIRERLVNEKWLKGVVSMPSNIFATTGTNVSVIFIDKQNKGDVILVDASKLGQKVKEGKNQKTLLSPDDEQKIISAFATHHCVPNRHSTLDAEQDHPRHCVPNRHSTLDAEQDHPRHCGHDLQSPETTGDDDLRQHDDNTDFAVVLSYDAIKAKNYSLAAGQYFDIKIEYSEISPEEFQQKIDGYNSRLNEYFEQGKKLEAEILENLNRLKMEIT